MPSVRRDCARSGTTTLRRSSGGVGWLFPFSFQFFTRLAAVFAEDSIFATFTTRCLAEELDDALSVLSKFDEGPDKFHGEVSLD